MTDTDYVIVGAGAAGPIIAVRLSEDPTVNVVLLEAGPENTNEVGRIQGAFYMMWGTDADWAYQTTPQPGLNGRQIFHPRGKVMGGSTAINVGAWLRGAQPDYDAWAKAGATGWDFAAALQTFRQVEHTDRGPSAWRGSDGPIQMADLRSPTPLADALLDAFAETGYGPHGDVNAATPYVADRYQTLFPQHRRRTPADAYLDDTVRARPNLTILTAALATQVLFDGTRAVGVRYLKDSQQHELRVAREVVLSAGAINTPQLLMLSGIGPAAHLRAHGIDVVADIPGVGENLQDHLFVQIRALAAPEVTGSVAMDPSPAAIEQWRTDRTGPAIYWAQNGVGFINTDSHTDGPDFELMFQYTPDLGDGAYFPGVSADESRTGYTIAAILLHPHSRGTVRLASADPLDKPIVDPRYVSDRRDLAAFVDGLRAAQKITQAATLKPYTEQIYPPLGADDHVFESLVRADATTAFHPVGTAKMGDLSDPATVVDAQLRVRGVHGLRVADASVFPTTISGHTMAPTVFVGERAAHLIRASD